jgi:hypothetical protein
LPRGITFNNDFTKLFIINRGKTVLVYSCKWKILYVNFVLYSSDTPTQFSYVYLVVLCIVSSVDKLYGSLKWKSNYCFICTWYYSNTPRWTGQRYFIFIQMEGLCCINLDGHVIYRYDISGWLGGLAVDQQGHVYISGADDIHRLSLQQWHSNTILLCLSCCPLYC